MRTAKTPTDIRAGCYKNPAARCVMYNFGAHGVSPKITVTQTARLILRERVDFARQQPDRNRQNRAATVDSCFVLIGTRQHGVAVLYETILRQLTALSFAVLCSFHVQNYCTFVCGCFCCSHPSGTSFVLPQTILFNP